MKKHFIKFIITILTIMFSVNSYAFEYKGTWVPKREHGGVGPVAISDDQIFLSIGPVDNVEYKKVLQEGNIVTIESVPFNRMGVGKEKWVVRFDFKNEKTADVTITLVELKNNAEDSRSDRLIFLTSKTPQKRPNDPQYYEGVSGFVQKEKEMMAKQKFDSEADIRKKASSAYGIWVAEPKLASDRYTKTLIMDDKAFKFGSTNNLLKYQYEVKSIDGNIFTLAVDEGSREPVIYKVTVIDDKTMNITITNKDLKGNQYDVTYNFKLVTKEIPKYMKRINDFIEDYIEDHPNIDFGFKVKFYHER